MSHIGTRLCSKHGYKNLAKDRDYFYIGRPASNEFLNICFFSENPLKVYFDRITTVDFDKGIESGEIEHKDSLPYPPWVARYISKRLKSQSKEMSLKAFSAKHASLTDDRYSKIAPLTDDYKNITSAYNPCALINKYAKEHKPELNQARTRTHFFAYVCFGFSRNALLPDTWKNGRWDRSKHPDTKFGRKVTSPGAVAGWPSSQVSKEKCIKGYEKYARTGRAYNKIYKDVLRYEFGCRARSVGRKLELYHPKGDPYPTMEQFKQELINKFGRQRLDVKRYGKNRARKSLRQSNGQFTEHSINIMERIEGDVYYAKEVHNGIEAAEMPAMCIARLIDTATGMRLGIGASLNGEKASAYSMAFFSMGMPKDIFCSLFGLDINRSDWPVEGVPLSYAFDRGPGTKKDFLLNVKEFLSHIEMAPTHSGQSKAVSEATHPRATKIDGAPVYEISGLNYVEYFKQEIINTIEQNRTSDVSGRLNREYVENSVLPRPIHMWNYLSSKLRSDSIPIDWENLVRGFLTKRKCRISKRGAFLEGIRYQSSQLFESGLCERLPGNQSFEVDAYLYDLCIRQIWIEYDDVLIEVFLVPSTGVGEDDIDWSLEMLSEYNTKRRRLQRQAEREDLAAKIYLMEEYEKQTGLKLDSGRQQAKRPKRKKPEAIRELATLNKLFGPNK